jgi:hypothetical protein
MKPTWIHFFSKSLLSFHDFPRGRCVRGQRLLAQYGQAPLPNLEQHLFVKKSRGRNYDSIDVFSAQSLSDIGERGGRRSRFCSLFCPRHVSVDHDCNLGSDDSAGKTLDMIGAHFTGTDNTYFQVC